MKLLRYVFTVCFLLAFNTAYSQLNLQTIELHGKVHENGKGIPHVAVTDGINITVTDAKGEYKLLSNGTAEFVYITLPSGYYIPIQDKVPHIYKKIEDKTKKNQRFDFTLQKAAKDDTKHVMIVWADPQVNFEDEIPQVRKAAKDVSELIKSKYSDIPSYGIVCGDIIHDINKEAKLYPPMKDVIAETDIPFFYLIGNHDINLDVRSDEFAKETYKGYFGPTYYSFNRGKIHYIVLDDVFYAGNSFYYIGYIGERQLNWLQQDLALVPEGSTVVVSLHIPTYSAEARKKEWGKETMIRVLQNRQALYKILEPYNAHIFSGHEHQNENFVIADNIFEHNHAALCGLFWQAPWCHDGTPMGYAVYEIDGENIKWYYKTVGKDKSYQFNLYPVGASRDKPDAITANIWNYGPAWKIYWYEDDVRMGEMQQYTGYDANIDGYVKEHRKEFKYNWISIKPTDHMFYAVPKNKDAKIKVEAVDRFGNSYFQEL